MALHGLVAGDGAPAESRDPEEGEEEADDPDHDPDPRDDEQEEDPDHDEGDADSDHTVGLSGPAKGKRRRAQRCRTTRRSSVISRIV
jgi:hypothetical protein